MAYILLTAGDGGTRLFWSRRGDVLCVSHAPAPGSREAMSDGWEEITDARLRDDRFQCQQCEGRSLKRPGRPNRM